MVDNRGPGTLGVAIALFVGAVIALALRCYVRFRLVKRFGWEDGFMLVAFIGQVLFVMCTIGTIHWGAGRQHMENLSTKEATAALKWIWVSQIGYGVATIAVRISIGLLLLRFIVSNVQRWIIYITIATSASVSLVVFLIALFECKPLDVFWDPTRTASCNSSKISVVTGIIGSFVSIVCDFSLSITPIVMVWKLNLKRKTKLALVPIFGLGTCASIGAILEIVYLIILNAHDFTYEILNVILWCHVEIGMAVIAANLITIRPLYRQVKAKFGFGPGTTNFFKMKTPRWTAMFTRNEERNAKAAQRHSTPQKSGESYTLVDSMSRERPKPLKHLGVLPDVESQEDRTVSSDDIRPLVDQI